MSSQMGMELYLPKNVQNCLAIGTTSFIGFVDDTTVLKYPLIEQDKPSLANIRLEARLLQTVGPHKNIIDCKGLTEDGLLLEYATRGTIFEYLQINQPSLQQRLDWAYQTTEALTAVQRKRVLHRDLSTSNLLLDKDLQIKLIDFQGQLLAPNGSILLDGKAREKAKSYMPRAYPDTSDYKMDLFALASVFYYMLESHEPYPELDSWKDQEEIVRKFSSGQFPRIERSEKMDIVAQKCWRGEFHWAAAVLNELAFIREKKGGT